MVDLKQLQKEIYQNKINKGFNTTDINQEFCYIYGETSEAHEAWRKKEDTLGEELAEITKNDGVIIAIVDKTAEKIITAFMLGPLTVVLKKNKEIADYVTNGKDTIAVRMATSDVLKEIIEKVKSPLFMTSANISGKPTCNNLDEIENACPLLDGMLEGKIIFSKGSTIIDCTSNEVKVLRPGPISLEKIIETLNK